MLPVCDNAGDVASPDAAASPPASAARGCRGAPAQKPKPKRACTQGRRAYAAQKPRRLTVAAVFVSSIVLMRASLSLLRHVSVPFCRPTNATGISALARLVAALQVALEGVRGGDEDTVGRKPSSTHRPDGGNCENISSIDPLVR